MDINFDKSTRKHDQVYLKHDRYDEPLEIFKFTGGILNNSCGQKNTEASPLKLLDVGAATGEFLWYLQNYFQFELTGLELLPELAEKANQRLDGIVKVGDVFDQDCFEENQFDCISMIGTHMIFEELESVFKSFKKWLKPDGHLLIVGAFNPNQYSVWVRYADMTKKNTELEHGWNIHSLEATENLLKDLQFKEISNKEFIIPVDVQPDPDDALRQYTLKLETGDRVILNGLSQAVQIYSVLATL